MTQQNIINVTNASRMSCCLSLIGAAIVIMAYLRPQNRRVRRGRELVMWLSICDFFSSLIYFMNSFFQDENGMICTMYALLGILFPVASFCYTDAIAYYLFSSIVYPHSFVSEKSWNLNLAWIHITAWSISVACTCLVGLSNHAGRNDDGESFTGTGGWCWIKADDYNTLFLFQLIGGKFIEWVSCFFFLPVLYGASCYHMYVLNQTTTMTAMGYSSSIDDKDQPIFSGSFISSHDGSACTYLGLDAIGRLPDTPLPYVQYASLDHDLPLVHDSWDMSDEGAGHVQGQEDAASNAEAGYSKKMSSMSVFFVRMATVPVIFFVIRLWGSLRVLLTFLSVSHRHHRGTDSWLEVLQAVFDPSQGFCNFLLFIAFSQEDRTNLIRSAQGALWYLQSALKRWSYVVISTGCRCCIWPQYGNKMSKLDRETDATTSESRIAMEPNLWLYDYSDFLVYSDLLLSQSATSRPATHARAGSDSGDSSSSQHAPARPDQFSSSSSVDAKDSNEYDRPAISVSTIDSQSPYHLAGGR